MRRAPWALFAAFVLSACATAYRSEGFMGGFSETALGPNMYRVSFQGSGVGEEGRVADFVLLRAAELTLREGYPYFFVAGARESSDAYAMASAASPVVVVGGMNPRAEVTIIMANEREPGRITYEALFLQNSLRAKYRLR